MKLVGYSNVVLLFFFFFFAILYGEFAEGRRMIAGRQQVESFSISLSSRKLTKFDCPILTCKEDGDCMSTECNCDNGSCKLKSAPPTPLPTTNQEEEDEDEDTTESFDYYGLMRLDNEWVPQDDNQQVDPLFPTANQDDQDEEEDDQEMTNQEDQLQSDLEITNQQSLEESDNYDPISDNQDPITQENDQYIDLTNPEEEEEGGSNSLRRRRRSKPFRYFKPSKDGYENKNGVYSFPHRSEFINESSENVEDTSQASLPAFSQAGKGKDPFRYYVEGSNKYTKGEEKKKRKRNPEDDK